MKELFITGMGVMTSIGNNVVDFWNGLLHGKSGVKKIKAFDIEHHANKYGCEIEQLDDYVCKNHPPLGRATSMFITALDDALYDARLDLAAEHNYRIGITVGTTMGEVNAFEDRLRDKISGFGGPFVIADTIADIYKVSGPRWTLTNACAAGNFSIAKAMDELQSGRADIMIAGGVDVMSWAAFTGFSSLRAMAPELCTPFDVNRKGLLLGEGVGVLIIETKESLEKRSVAPYAKLAGYGLNCDAYHITQPDPQAKSAIRAMQDALAMGNVSKDHVGYVSAHGTGTLANDRMEAKALSTFMGRHTKTSSIKANIGHTLGAASAIEAIMSVKVLETGILPPTLHLTTKDPGCDVDVIAHEPRNHKVNYVLSNAYAFGGINSSLLLEKV